MTQDTDKLKNALKTVIDIVEGVDEALEDGKLSLAEALSIGVAAVPAGAAVWTSRAELLEELRDLEDDEMIDLENFIATEFDIRNDAAERVVEAAISFVVGGVELGLAVKDLKNSANPLGVE